MRWLRPILTLAALTTAAIALVGYGEGLLAVLPALLLLAPLLCGRYVGETALGRLRRAVPHGRRRRPRAASWRRPAVRVGVPTGTALLAYGRAVRPPPVLAV